MLIHKNFNEQLSFYETAIGYLERGWSSIPVWGAARPDSFKVAAIQWSRYTRQHPRIDELRYWFSYGGFRGIGIITGTLSGLAVLDFDDEQKYQLFCERFPHLAQTYTVKTPRGWHLYFQIPTNCTTITKKGQGIDWQWETRYVVAPPTRGYRIQDNQTPRILKQRDIKLIETFIRIETPVAEREHIPSVGHLDKTDLIGYYNNNAHYGNRNNALFNACLMARDYGYTQQATTEILASRHAQNRHHLSERLATRHREALATIKSAFSRPPRPIKSLSSLPNTIKEALMARGWVCALRVIEGLRQLGYSDEQGICRTEAVATLEGIVGEHSIRKTFSTGLLECVETPQNPFPAGMASKAKDTITKCTVIGCSKPSETSQGGRPTKWYLLPSNAELAEKLGVKLRRVADALDLDDLKSAKQTRKAMHRKYIERRPGQYPSKWLSKRLGISRITKNRYDNETEDLHKRAEYESKCLHWGNLNEIPDLEAPSMFLEDESGKRYPPKRALAGKLMKQQHKLKLMKQTFNSYWIGSESDAPQSQALQFEKLAI